MIEIGESVPDFSLVDINGGRHALAEQRGTLVVLNFWSATCPWSQRADEIVAGLREHWGDRVKVWCIACNEDESREEVQRVAEERSLPVVLHDPGCGVADLFKARTTPHFFVVDAEGVLRFRGALDDTTFRQRNPGRHFLAEAVAAMLNGELPNPADTPAYGCTIVRPFA